MLKILLTAIAGLVLGNVFANGLLPGDSLPPDLALRDLKSGKLVTTASLKGKAVIIDCWATWCSPCIEGMKELEEWQKQFGDKIVILAVSEERADRLMKFMKNRPVAFTVVSDTAGLVRKLFPHRTIPHTVLVGPDGKVKAITAPENISTAIIQKLLLNHAFSLPLKQDQLDFNLEAYFNADTTLSRNFIMQPAVEGQGSFSKSYPNSTFDQRRLTIVNGTMRLLYQLATKKTFYRMADEYNGNRSYKEQEKFSIDVWVPEKDEAALLKYMRVKLSRKFADVEVVLEKRSMEVAVLYADSSTARKLVHCNEPVKSIDANSLSFGGQCATIAQLADYLEGFGKYGMAVEDETGLTGRYRLAFELEPGKSSALNEALAGFGLYVKKEKRIIDVVVIRKKQ